jgi:hypothetical protein
MYRFYPLYETLFRDAGTHEVLREYTHGELSRYTHEELAAVTSREAEL